MNPFILISDILALIDLLSGGGKGNVKGGKNKNKNRNRLKKPNSRPGQRFRNKVTTSGGRSTGPLRGLREFFRKGKGFLGKKIDISGTGKGAGNWLLIYLIITRSKKRNN